MQPQPSSATRRHVPVAVLLPVVLVLALAIVALLGFVVWSTTNIDQRSLERQKDSIARVLQFRRSQIEVQATSVAVWDETLINTKLAFNANWIERNLSSRMHENFGYDALVVVDASNKPLYAMVDGFAVVIPDTGAAHEPFQSLLSDLRTLRTAPGPLGTRQVPATITDFLVIDGRPAMVTASTIVSDTGALRQQPGSEYALVLTRFLDTTVAAEINRQYVIDGGHFTMVGATTADQAVFPVVNNAGRFITFFQWNLDRPGQTVLNQTIPMLGLTFLVIGGLVMLLLNQLRRYAEALEAGKHFSRYQASHDELTGLPNRSSFEFELRRRVDMRGQCTGDTYLLMLDLDRFKQVNDTLGHQAGDELICAVADRLKAVLGKDALIARLGGDEFGIVVSHTDGPFDVQQASQRIISAIGQSFELRHYKAHVGASIGIVVIDRNSEDVAPSELMRKADIALYEAKAGGRNRAMVYEEHMNEMLQLQHTIEGELREALQRDDQLSVVFQPLVSQESRRVVGAEALSRWAHPKFGQISPGRFIPVAENTGLIEALGEFVLRRACELGATAPGRTIAVNISPTQLRNPQFSHLVFDILHRSGMRPNDLELEITESILLDDEHVSSQNLRTFRTAGIKIALDDFGTGYSSLSYLKRYPVDRIKIDRSFVNQLAEGHDSVAITRAIVTLAHAMDLEVTAEGVETEDQASILAQMGCNMLQGFLFSSGVPRERIVDIFADPANALVSRGSRAIRAISR
ncbi:EAL domain-containing protein [Devosia sp. FKR38]|uniref:putative bifunctional diguanylate cyclase/phosphodiesterase n=1 Tax=Devosia sp. FKR38 TaxID=2562312 RepID=UPI0010BFFD60|nr:EAL domain-containing protein [Devosia sp. FKR38]